MKGRRITLDLTPAATKELDRIKKITGMASVDVFRHGFSLLRIYVETKQNMREFRIVDPLGIANDVRIEMPIDV